MQHGVKTTGRKWLGGEGVWSYCIKKGKRSWEPIAWIYAKGVTGRDVNVACEPDGRVLAVGGTIDGLRGFIERVSENWEV